MSEPGREWTTFGRYVLLNKIGTGGMAEIYRAKTFGAAGFEKEFAIKMILPALVDDQEFVAMFINEAKIAVSLYHANVVQVFDLGTLDDQYYIAMEYVHGKDLLDVLAKCAELEIKLPLHITLFVAMEMLKGLDFAHRAKNVYGEDLNIIHRDVSPSNILISYAGDVKVGDFGVAKAANQKSMTDSGTLKGKVGYMSPEQVMGETIDSRSDIFSAGIVFFEALSMNRLFVGGSDLDVMLRVRDADIRDSIAKTEPLPSDLVSLVERSMAKHRQERYQTAGEFYQALVDFCFRHSIKVTESDLSNFMRRLFAEEIEQEKQRRIDDPRAQVIEQHMDLHDIQSPLASKQTVGMDTIDGDLDALSSTPYERHYRYRDAEGRVYGPMTLTTLVSLLHQNPSAEGGRYSIDGQSWHKREAFKEVVEAMGKAPSEKIKQVGAVIFKPKETRHAPHDAASTEVESIPAQPTQEQAIADTVEADMLTPQEIEQMLQGAELDQAIEGALSEGSQTDALGPPFTQEPLSARDVEAIKEHYTAHEGSFAHVSFARIFHRVHRAGGTGCLRVYQGEIEKEMYYKNGELILVDSNREEELLGSFLTDRGLITEAQLQGGLARLNEWGGRLGDALVATGAIPAHDIFRLLSEQMSMKVLDVFTWREGSYGYFENQEPGTHGYPLDVNCDDLLVAGCRQHVPFERIVELYGRNLHTPLIRQSPVPYKIDELKFRATELRIAKEASDGATLHALIHKFPPSQRELIYRTIYLLHQTEILTFEFGASASDFPG